MPTQEANTRTAALFRNAQNLAVRIPRDWIEPGSDVQSVVMTRTGECITLTPIHNEHDLLAAFLNTVADSPIPESELDGWDEDPATPITKDIDL